LFNIIVINCSAYSLRDSQAEASDEQRKEYSSSSKEDDGSYKPGDPPFQPSLKIKMVDSNQKIVMITIDDGPSNLTPQFLDVLKENNVHATFCVIGNRASSYPDIIKRAYSEGNAIINHSYTHVYNEIYASPDSITGTIKACNKVLDSLINRTPLEKMFFRPPGGSSMPQFRKNRALPEALKALGYYTLDWNVTTGDTSTNSATFENILRDGTNDGGGSVIVILMHDFKYRSTTLQALPYIIKHYKEMGYTFKTIRDITEYDLQRLKQKRIVNMLY
jgi:Predicted xylanase/chitin deacetylase